MAVPRLTPVTEIKRRATEVIADVRATRQPVLITERGRSAAVLLDVETYDALLRRLAVLEGIARGERAYAEGRSCRAPRREGGCGGGSALAPDLDGTGPRGPRTHRELDRRRERAGRVRPGSLSLGRRGTVGARSGIRPPGIRSSLHPLPRGDRPALPGDLPARPAAGAHRSRREKRASAATRPAAVAGRGAGGETTRSVRCLLLRLRDDRQVGHRCDHPNGVTVPAGYYRRCEGSSDNGRLSVTDEPAPRTTYRCFGSQAWQSS